MKLCAFTLALDAIRFLPRQLAVFEQLKLDWHWFIISGVADSVLDTSWVAKIPPRLSLDGTDEWLTRHLDHPNITVIRRQLWPGKNAMVQAAISKITEPCVVMQIDADEIWLPSQLETICEQFSQDHCDRMRFYCRYFVGPDLIVTTENLWANRPGEWNRAWRWTPHMVSIKHEPPLFQGIGHREMDREATRALGLVFNHEAYVYEDQVAFKEKYYLYPGAVAGWKRLQAHTQFPTKLKPFMHWVEDGVMVDKIPQLPPLQLAPDLAH